MNKKFEYMDVIGPCTGCGSEHLYCTKKWNNKKLKKIKEIYGIIIGSDYDLIIHDEPDSHSIMITFNATEESDLVAFKLIWI